MYLQKTTKIDFLDQLQQMSESLSGNEKDFFLRVWSINHSMYENRLKAIGFNNYVKVLDAGCGFGQWSACLATLNKSVYALDNSEVRVHLVNQIAELLDIKNLYTSVGSIEHLEFPDSEFDAIFCYSVILFSDYKKVIKEFGRVLKRGGKLYICSNGLGWYLYNIMSGHNSASDFDSRNMAIRAIENTFSYFNEGTIIPGEQLVIPGKEMVNELRKNNFSIKGFNGEGLYNIENNIEITPFFKSEYLGAEGVYEIIAESE